MAALTKLNRLGILGPRVSLRSPEDDGEVSLVWRRHPAGFIR